MALVPRTFVFTVLEAEVRLQYHRLLSLRPSLKAYRDNTSYALNSISSTMPPELSLIEEINMIEFTARPHFNLIALQGPSL